MDADLFRVFFDNVQVGVTVSDSKGDMIYVNAAQLKRSNFNYKEYMALNAHRVYEDKIADICLFDKVMQTKCESTAIQKTHHSGDINYEKLVTATPIFDSDGRIEYVVTTYLDLDVFHEQYAKALLTKKTAIQLHKFNAPHENIIYKSDTIANLLNVALSVAGTDSSVLLCGESGTGKEVFAHFIHNKSIRSDKEMVTINCASLPPSLLEAELFGYEKGAFTGASVNGKQGLIETAAGSTLFLDEINSMSLELQGKLLRVLETKKIKRIGSVKEKEIDFRLITATNTDLRTEIEMKTFRTDFYYRISVVPLFIPPLRERREDIPVLCDHFVEHYNEKYGKTKVLSSGAHAALKSYDWPGNVRELKNLIERLIVTAAESDSVMYYIPEEMFNGAIFIDQPKKLKRKPSDDSNMKPETIVQALISNDCNREKAAEALGVSLRTLHYKLKKYDITVKAVRQIYIGGTPYQL